MQQTVYTAMHAVSISATGWTYPYKCVVMIQLKSAKKVNDQKTLIKQVFLKLCSYLEANDEEQLTISDICDKMSEYLSHKDSVPYAATYLKHKLQEHYKDSIFIAEKGGLSDIVTF